MLHYSRHWNFWSPWFSKTNISKEEFSHVTLLALCVSLGQIDSISDLHMKCMKMLWITITRLGGETVLHASATTPLFKLYQILAPSFIEGHSSGATFFSTTHLLIGVSASWTANLCSLQQSARTYRINTRTDRYRFDWNGIDSACCGDAAACSDLHHRTVQLL